MYSFSQSFHTKKSGRSKKFKIGKKTLLAVGGVVIFLLLFGYFAIYSPVMKIKASAQALSAEAKLLKADVKSNDIDLMTKRLDSVSVKYQDLERDSKSVYWAAFIPYVKDYKSSIEAGRYVIDAGKESVKAIYPYADLIGLKKGEAGFAEKTAEDRLQTAVLTLDKMLSRIDVIAEKIDEAEKRIETIDPNRYPEKIGKYAVRGTVEQYKNQFDGMASLFVDAKPFLKELPKILGSDGERTYLILFQNTAERRATGGFLTFYAVMNVNKGKLTIKDSSDMYDIDNNIAVHPTAPDKILAYHKDVSKFYIRDSNLSPDLVESIKLFNSLYNKAGNKVDYDGIFMLDSKVLVDMLRIFGDSQVSGINFSATNDPRCDCPQVIYTLFDIVDRPVNYVKVDRKRVLGNLMLELFYKAIGFSPSKYWGQLAQTMFLNLDEKNILLYFKDKETQAAVERLNYGGRIRAYDGDYLHVNNVNFAGAKSNLFIDEQIISDTKFEGDQIKRTVTMRFQNPYEHSDCNLERGGLCLNATLRNWIRFYVPEGSKLVSFTGSQKKTLTYDELGKTVFEGFMTVNPKGQAEVTVEYILPKSVSQKNYSIMVQKQPGVEKQSLQVTVNGKKMFDDNLNTDKTVK